MYYNHFNPRPREEGDDFCRAHKLIDHYFNPRPREEGDSYRVLFEHQSILFQSTPS